MSVSLGAGFAARWKHDQPQLLATSETGSSFGYVPEYRVGDDESSRGSLWWSMFGDCIGMGRTGAEAHGVRVVFASCSRLRTALTFTFCIICFCGDESTTFAQVCVRAYAFYVWYIGISAHIEKCI